MTDTGSWHPDLLFGQFHLEAAGAPQDAGGEVHRKNVLGGLVGRNWGVEALHSGTYFLHRFAAVDVVPIEDEYIGCFSSSAVEDHGNMRDVGGMGKELPAAVQV